MYDPGTARVVLDDPLALCWEVKWRVFAPEQRAQWNMPYSDTCVFADHTTMQVWDEENVYEYEHTEEDT